MKTSVITCFKKYVTVKGRASRSEYWWFTLFNVLVSLFIGFGIGFITIILAWDTNFSDMVFDITINTLTLIIMLPAICVSVRRLHDTDRRGWWVLLWLIPLVGGIVMLFFTCEKSMEGDNRFGKDPLAE